MESITHEFLPFSWRATALHMIAYLVAGLIALIFINYIVFLNQFWPLQIDLQRAGIFI